VDIVFAGRSDQGRRKNNEDFIAYFEPTDPDELKNYGCLFIVADGVGGAAKGERASQYAAQKILFDYFQPCEPDPDSSTPLLIEPLDYLRNILRQVNEEINDYATQNDTRMATTVVAAVVREGFLYVANVGDSRAYLIRDGVAAPINRDHSLVGEMVEHGEMTEAEAMASSIKNRLTRSLGGDPDVIVDGYPPVQLQIGDKILLCSDGLTRYALQEDIARMTESGTPEEIAERLIKFANDSGGADNVSAIVVAYKSMETIEQSVLPISPRPQDVDFETVTPQEYKAIRTNSYFGKGFLSRRQLQFLLVLIGVISVLVLVNFSFVIIKKGIDRIIATDTVVTLPTLITTEIPNPPTLTKTPNLPTFTETSTPLVGTLPTEILTSPTSLSAEVDSWCVSLVQAEGLKATLTDLGLPYDPTIKYDYCILNSDKTLCASGPFTLDDNDKIQNDWWIIIKDLDNQESCIKHERKWVSEP
jgi:protein phosphatase